jgi:methyl-accepting chemotaxis protein
MLQYQNFGNQSLGVKLIGGFCLVAFITLGIGFVGWRGVTTINGILDNIVSETMPSLKNLLIVQKNLESLRAAQNALLNPAFDKAKRQELLNQVDKARENYRNAWAAYEKVHKSGEKARIWEQLKQAIDAWRNENNVFFQLTQELEKIGEASAISTIFQKMNKQLIEKNLPRQFEALSLLDKLISQEETQAEALRKEADTSSTRAQYLSLTGMVGGFAVALILGFILSLSITRPVKRIINGLNEGADQVSSASNEVSAASQSLAQGSSEQAAALEETSSSLEEMSSMTKQNADNANQANALMNETSKVVDKATHSMSELTAGMQEISAASEQTAKIVKTIDEIAFQTNLLALNAAVEAARAGEAGAGFAVVADEVRNLAMRAADAAKNTANLIDTTVNKVKDGVELVSRTAEDFAQVSGSTIKVKDLVGEIAAASNEQAQGIGQISKAVAEMDQVVQQNAANAEESASASEELSAQAAQMKSVVGDLVILVEGGKGKTGRHGEAERTRPVMKKTGKGLSILAKSRGQLAKMPARKAGEARVVTPEQVIPLDDKEFKDF